MANQYTIGQLAKAAEVPTSTLRYYERIGLVRPTNRSEGNYRLYDREALERVRFIRSAQATGFTLDDVTTLLNLRVAANAPCEDVQFLMDERLSDVRNRMKELRHVERVLKSFLEKCRQTGRQGYCAVIEELNAACFAPLSNATRAGRRERVVELAKALRDFDFPLRLGSDEAQLRIGVLRLVAKGRPVSVEQVEQVASRLSIPSEVAISFVSKVSEQDEQGNIVGILGLSQRAHPHRFQIQDLIFSTWCAWDALFLPALLRKRATVESACPVTKERISLRITPKKVARVSPPDSVVTIAVPTTRPETVQDVWVAFCRLVHFFASEQAACLWAAKKKQDLRIVSVEEAFDLGQRAFDKLPP